MWPRHGIGRSGSVPGLERPSSSAWERSKTMEKLDGTHTRVSPHSGADGPQPRLCAHAWRCPCGPPLPGASGG
jgi:hypothetical protein